MPKDIRQIHIQAYDLAVQSSERIDVVDMKIELVVVQRAKYGCNCGQAIETAIGPARATEGGRYSLAFAIHVAIAKYLYHLPLERQDRRRAQALPKHGVARGHDHAARLAESARVDPQAARPGRGHSVHAQRVVATHALPRRPRDLARQQSHRATAQRSGVGRRNHFGSKTQRGTEVAALFYTLIESAKLANVPITDYLTAVVLAARNEPKQDVALLPAAFAAARAAELSN